MIGHIKAGQYLKKYCLGNIFLILPSSQSAWNTRFYFGHQKLCMDNNVKYIDAYLDAPDNAISGNEPSSEMLTSQSHIPE